jgi:hypothetical protein
MATLTIRNVPEETVEALKEMASRNGRSMEEELRRLISAQVMDRLSVMRQIDESVQKQTRPTTREEVDRWIRERRP